jgi:hypothetical protein
MWIPARTCALHRANHSLRMQNQGREGEMGAQVDVVDVVAVVLGAGYTVRGRTRPGFEGSDNAASREAQHQLTSAAGCCLRSLATAPCSGRAGVV